MNKIIDAGIEVLSRFEDALHTAALLNINDIASSKYFYLQPTTASQIDPAKFVCILQDITNPLPINDLRHII